MSVIYAGFNDILLKYLLFKWSRYNIIRQLDLTNVIILNFCEFCIKLHSPVNKTDDNTDNC